MRKPALIFFSLVIVTLQACVYRMDIPQGNQVDKAKLDQLQLGMTRSQVNILLGDPAINDLYHANQAYYVYYLFDGKQRKTELRNMQLTFEKDTLVDIKGSL
jgi:outer membrane protein assembly factor BamE